MIYFPKGWDLLDEAQKMVICNGCGGKMLKVPDKILGLDIKLVCNIHDFMYAMGETEEDKDKADTAFLRNLIAVIDSNAKASLKDRLLAYPRRCLATVYYGAVRDFGMFYFKKKGQSVMEKRIVNEIRAKLQKNKGI